MAKLTILSLFDQIARPLEDARTQNCDRSRGGVEDTRLEAKDTKKIRGQGQGQGQPFRGQTLSRPRTGMLEAKAKDQGHKAQVLSKKKKKKVFTKIFQAISKKKKKKKKKKVFTKIFQAISTKKRFPKNFSSVPQNFNIPKNSAVLEPRTGQFSRTSSRPRTSSRTPPLDRSISYGIWGHISRPLF